MSISDKLQQAQSLLGQADRELADELTREKGRRRSQLNNTRWQVLKMLGRVGPYFSQSGQDHFVDQSLMHEKTEGVFVDIGGYDGVTGSNSLFFEMFRNWSGILVEPVPEMLDAARSCRRCECLGVGVAAQTGEMEFLQIEEGYRQMSGFLATYDAALLEKVRANPRHKEKVITVETRTLPDLLTEHGLREVDYLSLDVEGGELEIMRNFPFDAFNIRVWSIENNARAPEIPALMRVNGYRLAEFCGVDDIYVLAQ